MNKRRILVDLLPFLPEENSTHVIQWTKDIMDKAGEDKNNIEPVIKKL